MIPIHNCASYFWFPKWSPTLHPRQDGTWQVYFKILHFLSVSIPMTILHTQPTLVLMMLGKLLILKDVVKLFPSIHPLTHPSMASLQPIWLRFCCTLRKSHIIQQCFFFGAKFCQLATNKNPVQPLGRNLKKNFRYIS